MNPVIFSIYLGLGFLALCALVAVTMRFAVVQREKMETAILPILKDPKYSVECKNGLIALYHLSMMPLTFPRAIFHTFKNLNQKPNINISSEEKQITQAIVKEYFFSVNFWSAPYVYILIALVNIVCLVLVLFLAFVAVFWKGALMVNQTLMKNIFSPDQVVSSEYSAC